MTGRSISRRSLLKGAAGAAAVVAGGPTLLRLGEPVRAAASPGEAAALRALGRTSLRVAGSRPFAALPAGADTVPQIEHVVVLMMENHSYDNLFGMLGRGDGYRLDRHGRPAATNPYPDGRIQHAFRMPTTCQLPSRPSQEWTASHNAYNRGRMNGFVRTPISSGNQKIVGGVAMGYWTAKDLPFTYGLANHFAIADRWYSSCLAQTDPNRRFLIAATAAGMTGDIGARAGNSSLGVPAPGGTIFQQFDLHGISWTNYCASYPGGATPELFPGQDTTEPANHKPFEQFFADAKDGTLPAFTLLDPSYGSQSQENPQNMVVGEAMMARVVHALGNSPLWRRSLLAIMYDEHGGYYDHVPPPVALAPDGIGPNVEAGEKTYDGFRRYGFRVPAVVVSPYSRRRHVTHRLHDHTSVLAFVEHKWNLPALSKRDANANGLRDFLDVDAMRAGRPTFPELPKLPAPGNTRRALACSSSGPGQVPPRGSISPKPRRHH